MEPKEIHFRITQPPVIGPCYYGIDTPNDTELIASHMEPEEIASQMGLNSLAYLSVEGMYEAVHSTQENSCDACMTKIYPIAPETT